MVNTCTCTDVFTITTTTRINQVGYIVLIAQGAQGFMAEIHKSHLRPQTESVYCRIPCTLL